MTKAKRTNALRVRVIKTPRAPSPFACLSDWLRWYVESLEPTIKARLADEIKRVDDNQRG
jgi:hypothetical protein